MNIKVRYRKVVLIAVGLMCMATSSRAQDMWRFNTQTHQEQPVIQRHSDGLDDVMQYLPYASVVGLKAFGVQSKDNWRDLLLTTAASWVATAVPAFALKNGVKEWRPDNTDQKSFPSGHSAVAFAGATMLRHEYGHLSPWISAAGYGVATFVAIDRVAKDRHHWYDAAAGAAIGAGMGELTWYLSRKVLKRKDVAIGFSGRQMDVVVNLGDGSRSKKETAVESANNEERTEIKDKEHVWTHSFWSDWYLQMGLDMTLQNPYGYNFSHVFPNGKTFGIDVAIGKWFTPELGVRGKFNWENGLGIFRNDHANWVAPFDQPGVNMDKGGYIAAYGDMMFNLTNVFLPLGDADYVPTIGGRKWNINVYPRLGVNYNFGVSKGSLLVGAGMMNTYRVSNRWSVYADVAYIMTGSGFVGKTKEEYGTGTGSNSNGYLSIGLGAQYDLGPKPANVGKNSVKLNGFFHNWFFQAGLDMSLMNPYGCNFSKVIPKGTTAGLNIAAGKWYTPEFGVRGRLQWENGFLKNKNLEWVPPVEDPSKNFKAGGFITGTLDAMFNLTNAIQGYQEDKKWHTSGFVRAGLIHHFEIDSASPVGGAGIEQTYRLNDRLSLFADLAYQVTTSESSGGVTGMDVASGSNGFFDIDFGIVVDLGRKTWKKR